MKQSLLLLFLLINTTIYTVPAATCNFTGSTGNWNVAGNWSTNSIPTVSDIAVISTGEVVTIPAGYAAVAQNVSISDGGKLTIAATASLSINGSVGTGVTGNGIYMTGLGTALSNSGTVNLGTSGTINLNGINQGGGTFTNETGGSINIGTLGNGPGISTYGTFFNYGAITMGAAANVAGGGIYINQFGSLYNYGTITMNRLLGYGIYTAANQALAANDGTITIGNLAQIYSGGINNSSVFTNNAAGIINIDLASSSSQPALSNSNNFKNYGNIKMGATGSLSYFALRNTGTFNNYAGSNIEINRAQGLNEPALSQAGGTFTNAGSIKIGNIATIRKYGVIVSSGTFNNSEGSTLEINNVQDFDGISLSGGTFSNSGMLKIGNLSAVYRSGINLNTVSGTFTNTSTGTLQLDGMPNAAAGSGAAIISSGGGSFTNAGTVSVGSNGGAGAGILKSTAGSATFTNTGTLTFGAITGNAIAANTVLTNNSGGVINAAGTLNNLGTIVNNAGSTLVVNGLLNNTASGTVTNSGTLRGSGTITQSGLFTSAAGSAIEPGNSPGTLTVNGDLDLGSATLHIEVAGTNPGTQYDVLNVNGTVTLGNAVVTVTKDAGFIPVTGNTFNFLTAAAVSGAFSAENYPAGFYSSNTAASRGLVFTATPLSIKLEKFAAQNASASNEISWNTVTETAGYIFNIERSSNGNDFKTIASLAGNGRPSAYRYSDNEPVSSPIDYYRLKIIESNGGVTYSNIAIVKAMNKVGGVIVTPVPALQIVTIINTNSLLDNTHASITDMCGRIMHCFMVGRTNEINISTWPAGVYSMKLANGEAIKILKE